MSESAPEPASAPAALALPAPGAPQATARGSGYIVGPFYDNLFFLYSPLLALVLGIAISHSSWSSEPVWVHGRWAFASNLFIGTVIAAHLVLVFVRSHGNATVRRRHPWRFSLVPICLFLALYSSIWISVAASVLAIWWDLYHSSLQTFGLGRLYERKAGNDVQVGRTLDLWLNLLLYAGPVLAGATLANHLHFCEGYLERVDSAFFSAIPARIQSWQSVLAWLVLGLGIPFLGYYVFAYWRLAQQGHRISPQKVFLLTSTGLCSIYTWGFNSFGQAFFIMNFFHAWQYFAIVWWSEGKSLRRLFRLEQSRWGVPLTLALFLLVPAGYGLLVTIVPMDTNSLLFSAAMVVTLMHFWYDGFIWSVRKNQV